MISFYFVSHKHSARVLSDHISWKKNRGQNKEQNKLRRFHDEVLEDTLTKIVTWHGQILRMTLEHNLQETFLVKSDNGSPLQNFVDATGVINSS